MTKTTPSNKLVVNRSYAYVLPMIALAHNLKLEDFTGFLGSYLFSEKHPHLQEHLFLHFKLEDSNKLHKHILKLLEASKHLEFTEEPDAFTIMYCFKIPTEYKREYNKFIESKYSEFSENYKQCIIRFHKLDSADNRVKNKKAVINVLYRTEDGYIAKEEYINNGLPSYQWTRIPRDQEIGALLEEIRDAETFKIPDNDEFPTDEI